MAPPEREPLVVIGIDAGDPELIERWMRDGHLPGLASIAAKGCRGTTGGLEMISEHGIWVSLFSGISRGSHGYYYFRQSSGKGYEIRNLTGADIAAPPFWSEFAGSDRRVLVVDVPDGYLIPSVPGVQLTNWAVHNPLAPAAASPDALLRDIRRVAGRDTRIEEDCSSNVDDDRRIYRQLLDRVERKGALCRHLIRREPFNLAVMVFGESHTGAHQFWRYRLEATRNERAEAGRDLMNAIRDIYIAIDRQVCAILALLPSDANVVIVSSVGLRDQYPTHGLIESFCRELGYQAAPRFDGSASRPIDMIRRMVPETWRLAVSRRFPRAVRERIVADQFRHGTDWSRTTVFALPSTYTSHLRVNLRGRETEGVVEPGAEYVAVLDRLEQDLLALIDPHTGSCPVKQVVRTVESFGGDVQETLPDMFVEWHPSSRFIEKLTHPRGVIAQGRPEFFRGSDHSLHGWVAAAGPGISGRGALGELPLLGLAPTFMELLGAPIPKHMEEPPLVQMLNGYSASVT